MVVVRGVLKIGLLGGIGPESTGDFYNRLIKKFQKKGLIRNNEDFPQIIINSIPAPELINDIANKDLIPYIKGLKELEKLNVDFIVMVCNTIHLFYDKLQGSIKTPILDIRKNVKNKLVNDKISSITVLGTSSTVKKGLYDFKNIKSINPDEKELKQLDDALFYFNRGVNKKEQSKICKKIAERCLKKGSQLIILGCTEIALMLKKTDIPKIDPFDLMVDLVVKLYKKQKFK